MIAAALSVLGSLVVYGCGMLSGYFFFEARRLRRLRRSPRPLADVPPAIFGRELLIRVYLQAREDGDVQGMARVQEVAALDPVLRAVIAEFTPPGTPFTTTAGKAQA